jgi:hypothetical protein
MKSKITNLKFILITSIISFVVFLIATFIVNEYLFFSSALSLCLAAMAYKAVGELRSKN